MATEPRPKKLLDQVSEAIRRKHYSSRTEETYVHWIKRFILFHDKRHPKDMGAAEVEAFLTHLAVQEKVAASTQNQAYSALLFLYRHVLNQPLDMPLDVVRAKKPEHLPTVLSRDEVRCPLLSPASTSTPSASGAGSSSSPPPAWPRTRKPA
ncbi:MAG: phage integrase N-terminal SAM-like domain-containing protein [Candidatus Caldarchaeum sp.]